LDLVAARKQAREGIRAVVARSVGLLRPTLRVMKDDRGARDDSATGIDNGAGDAPRGPSPSRQTNEKEGREQTRERRSVSLIVSEKFSLQNHGYDCLSTCDSIATNNEKNKSVNRAC